MIMNIQYKQTDTLPHSTVDEIAFVYNNVRERSNQAVTEMKIFLTSSFPFVAFGGLSFATSYRNFPDNRIFSAFPEGSACVKKIFLAFSEGSKGFIKKYFSPSEGSGSSKKNFFSPSEGSDGFKKNFLAPSEGSGDFKKIFLTPSEGSGGFIEKKKNPPEGSAHIKKCVWRLPEAFCK